jgi:hypothetical protein
MTGIVQENSAAEYVLRLFPTFVERVKLRFDGATGTKNVKAYFNTFAGKPQVTFKYGTRYYRFNLEAASEEERQYQKRNNLR